MTAKHLTTDHVLDPGLVIDETGVRRRLGNGIESVRWDELHGVSIITTSEGPFAEDVYFALHGPNDGGVLVPQGLATEHHLLEILQARLPGLDNEKIIQAMCCADDASFLIWKRPGGEQPV